MLTSRLCDCGLTAMAKRWYIIHAYSNFENKVADSIREQVLTKVELTDEAYHLIRNTPKVTGFLGSHKKPIPISDAEAAQVLQQIQEDIERPKPLVCFEVGEQVQVSDDPFSSFNATVEEIDDTRSRLKVAVLIFGRPTPVELEFSQVKKI